MIQMQFGEYQTLSGQTAFYADASRGTVKALSYVGLGLVGEAGEIANKLKKILRDDASLLTEEKRQQLIDELGDVLWYAAALATELHVGLGEVAMRNLDKLGQRKAKDTLGGAGDQR